MLDRVEMACWSLEMLDLITTTRTTLKDIEAEAKGIASRSIQIGNSPEAGLWTRTRCAGIDDCLDEIDALTRKMSKILREMDKKTERLFKDFA